MRFRIIAISLCALIALTFGTEARNVVEECRSLSDATTTANAGETNCLAMKTVFDGAAGFAASLSLRSGEKTGEIVEKIKNRA